MGPGVNNNKDLFSVKVLCKILITAYMSVTTHFGWLVGCFGFNGPLRQYFSLYQTVFQREGERGEEG